jgi:hypothetical protein
MMLDLADDEAAALTRYLRQKLYDERFPLAPRLDPLKAILAKLDPPGASTGTTTAAAAGHGAEPWAAQAPPMNAYDGPPMTLGKPSRRICG